MSRPTPNLRLVFLSSVVLLAFVGLALKLWYVQIARGSEYTAKLQKGSQVTVRIPAVRGEILDRNGIPLVQNRVSVDVDFCLPDIVRSYRENHGALPKLTYRATIHNMPKDLSEADITKIVSEEILPKLEEFGVAEDFNSKRLQVHYRTNREVPFNYRQDLDFETMAILSERNLGLPGVSVAQKPVRYYVYGALAAHLLGYVGPPNDLDKQPDIHDFNFYDPDMEGKAQIELFMDEYLRGKPGARILQRNAKGVIEGEVGIREPEQGASVYLTLDARIQYIVEKALRSVGRAAAVVLDPNSGDVLAMASVPSFDPNTFIPSIKASDWTALNKDDTNPLLNRAISSFAPGSTYKIFIALAGLEAGKAGVYPCGGGIAIGDTFMKCHSNNHGSFDLEGAIKASCNGYFYRLGIATGIDDIVRVGKLIGFGQKSGIPLSGESPGILPGPEYLAEVRPRERWSSGYTANTSIGQGEVLASPLQMAVLAATVANGGTCYYPRLIDKVVSPKGEVLLQEPSRVRSNLTADAGITPEMVAKVRAGMRKVVMEDGGTGRRARIEGIEVAGKTGTAQNWTTRNGQKIKDNHVWFISFAPFDKPRYAVAVLVQGGYAGGAVAAPIAGKILEDTFRLDEYAKEDERAETASSGGQDQPPAGGNAASEENVGDKENAPRAEPVLVATLEPAPGNFKFTQSIDFGRPIPAAQADGGDTETVAPTDATAESQDAARPENPNIREDADERGRVKNKERQPSGLQKFFNFFTGGERKEKPKKQRQQGQRP